MRKIKRPMLFETEDIQELEEHYKDRFVNLFSGAYAMDPDKYGEIRESIGKDFAYDKNILRYRQLHRKSWLKNKHKVIFEEEVDEVDQESAPEEPEAEQPTKIVQCTAVDIINRDLLTSPTETEPDIAESETE